jgi:hypothetical protein
MGNQSEIPSLLLSEFRQAGLKAHCALKLYENLKHTPGIELENPLIMSICLNKLQWFAPEESEKLIHTQILKYLTECKLENLFQALSYA